MSLLAQAVVGGLFILGCWNYSVLSGGVSDIKDYLLFVGLPMAAAGGAAMFGGSLSLEWIGGILNPPPNSNESVKPDQTIGLHDESIRLAERFRAAGMHQEAKMQGDIATFIVTNRYKGGAS